MRSRDRSPQTLLSDFKEKKAIKRILSQRDLRVSEQKEGANRSRKASLQGLWMRSERKQAYKKFKINN
jgi:hypothetical protein